MPNILADLLSKNVDNNINQLEKTFKLYTTKSTSNMHLFDKAKYIALVWDKLKKNQKVGNNLASKKLPI